MTTIANPYGGYGHGHQDEAQAVDTRVTATGETVAAQANSYVANANAAFARYLQDIRADEHHYTPDGQRARVQAFQESPAFGGINDQVAAVDSHVAELERKRNAAQAALSPNLDTAGELRATRAWDRHKQGLDNADGGKLAYQAQQAVLNARPDERGVLLAELPAYLEARGVPAGFISETAKAVAPDYASVEDELVAAKRAQTIVRHNAAAVTKAIEAGRPASVVVPLR